MHPVLLAVVVDGLAPNQWHEHFEVLAHVGGAPLVGEAEHVLDDQLVGQADAQGETSRGGRLGGEGLLGDGRRMPGVGGRDRRAEADALGLAADEGQGRDGVEGKDVGQPDVVEPGRLGVLGLADDAVEVVACAVRADHGAYAHGFAP